VRGHVRALKSGDMSPHSKKLPCSVLNCEKFIQCSICSKQLRFPPLG
jgi:hypothetical protein